MIELFSKGAGFFPRLKANFFAGIDADQFPRSRLHIFYLESFKSLRLLPQLMLNQGRKG